MKQLILTLIFLISVSVIAQNNNAALWLKSNKYETELIPWYLYHGDDYILDLRYNFDVHAHGTVFAGKMFANADSSIMFYPGAGCILGTEYLGIMPGFWLETEGSWYKWNTMTEYSIGKQYDFSYAWTEFRWKMHMAIEIGAGIQSYYEPRNGFHKTDIGPVVKVAFDNMYTKFWFTGTPEDGRKTLFIGLGMLF